MSIKNFFAANPRLRVLAANLERKDKEEIKKQVDLADNFLKNMQFN